MAAESSGEKRLSQARPAKGDHCLHDGASFAVDENEKVRIVRTFSLKINCVSRSAATAAAASTRVLVRARTLIPPFNNARRDRSMGERESAKCGLRLDEA
jgi:hypothetical protein